MPPPGGRARRAEHVRGAFHPPSKALSRSESASHSLRAPGDRHHPLPAASYAAEEAGEMPRGGRDAAGSRRGAREGKGFSRDWARFPVLWLKPVNMAAIGRGRSLKNLRIQGKSAAALTPGRPATATPGTCLPRALGGWSEPGRWSEPGLPPLAWERIVTGAMCLLFRAGRNDSGEENVPLDLTRGNARRWRGRPTGEEPGLGGRGQGPAPHPGPARAETEPRAEPRLPARGSSPGLSSRTIPPSSARFPLPKPFSGPLCLRCLGAPSRTRRSRRPSGFSRPRGSVVVLSRSWSSRIPGAAGGKVEAVI